MEIPLLGREGVKVHKDGRVYVGEVSMRIHLFDEYEDEARRVKKEESS